MAWEFPELGQKQFHFLGNSNIGVYTRVIGLKNWDLGVKAFYSGKIGGFIWETLGGYFKIFSLKAKAD